MCILCIPIYTSIVYICTRTYKHVDRGEQLEPCCLRVDSESKPAGFAQHSGNTVGTL